MNQAFDTIIWDWNGTLLDDVELSINSINSLLAQRNLPLLNTAHYKDIFCFPVRTYYERIGFDFSKEDFEIPAEEFINIFQAGIANTRLSIDASTILQYLQQKGYKQYILSAMEQSMLIEMTENLGINSYFEAIYGLSNIYAESKMSLGNKLIQQQQLIPEQCIMIGDSAHDAEVARSCGFNCLLYCGGHFSRQRLQQTGLNVVSRLIEIKNYL